jgi:hypothetical protein
MTKEKEAINFIKDIKQVLKDVFEDENTTAGDAITWLYNEQEKLDAVLQLLSKGKK